MTKANPLLRAMIEAAIRGEPIVMNGPLIDDLFARAAAGDEAALARIRRMLPVDDPQVLKLQHRDATLRRLQERLRLSGLGDREIGRLLHKAGRHYEQGRQDPLPPFAPFDRLDQIERRWIEAEVRKLLALLPDDDWLSAERIRKL